MKKDYIVPEMEITEFETEDVISDSGAPDTNYEEQGPWKQ